MYADFLCIVHNAKNTKSKQLSNLSVHWNKIEKAFNNLGLRGLPEPTRVYVVWINRYNKLLNFQGMLALFRSGSNFHLAYNLNSTDDLNNTQLDTFDFNELIENFNFISDDFLQLSATEKLYLYNRLVVFPDEREIEEQTARLKASYVYNNNSAFGRF